MKNSYTLIEILVAVSLFFIVMSSLTGFFLGAITSQRKSLASQELIDNVSYTLEYISRAIRMAKKDDVNGINCLSGNKVNFEITHGGQGVKFRNYKDECQEYFLETGVLKESKNTVINNLTSSNLEVISFKIGSQSSWDQDDHEQARVTLFLEVKNKSQKPELQPTIKIQTTISQRNLDVKY